MTVLVSVTHYARTRAYVEKAVRSVLAQTYRDFVCVVVGDGDEPPLQIRDDRLIVHSYPENHGAYFAQDVAIWASPHEWYAPVAADDWVDPDHLEKLVAYNADVACGALWYHNARHRTGTLIRKQYEVGIYRTERYTEIGAHNPSERIGQDSMTLKAMRIVRPVGASVHATYHRFGRGDSLSNAPETRVGSPARTKMRHRNGMIVAHCEAIARRTPNLKQRAALIKAYRESLVPPAIQAALEVEVEALRRKLGEAVAA